MERCCRACPPHPTRLKLLVTFREHKFVALLHRDISCSESIQALSVLVTELFPEESCVIHSLSLDGYILPGKYLIGDVCESGAQVEAKAEGKKQKRPTAAPQTEPTKKSKRSDEVTPAAKVKFSSLFQASEVKAEDKASDSDSDDSVFHGDKEKQRVNVFRKST